LDKKKENFGLIKKGIYSHAATTLEAQALFVSPKKDTGYFPIIGRACLKLSAIKEIVMVI